MPEYQRIVSYLYEYKNGVKGANVGFARIERRQKQLKLYFHVKTNAESLPYKIYFYQYRQGTMEGILIDNFQRNDVIVEMKNTYPLVVDLERVDGFLIYHSNDFFFGSEWNDKAISIRSFKPLEQNTVPSESPEASEALKPPEISETPELPETPEMPETPEPPEISETSEISENQNISEDLNTSNDSPKQTSANEVSSKLVEYIEALQLEKKAKERQSILEESIPSTKEFPSLSLPASSMLSSCIKIRLEDLASFEDIPKKLANNGFLLLNYEAFGHLILATHSKTKHRYLGVPGIFDNEKNFIAKFFGFTNFITVPEKEQKTNNFGYWILAL